ncbi:hypothetical protein E2C01_032675 [Portunus trituberculatus]|uniref:Uncharacterized protein n=1 Tax=Portunus trituberculatus TaxID=210409 RepID=A0A5B7F216_PORTR|nr:hypothetical protein [Portunus trituberculatus]
MHALTTHTSFTQNKKNVTPGLTALQVVTQNVLTPPATFSSLTSVTFAVLGLIFNLWNTTSPLLKIIFSSQKHSCLRQLTAALSLFPPIFSILIFVPKLDFAPM